MGGWVILILIIVIVVIIISVILSVIVIVVITLKILIVSIIVALPIPTNTTDPNPHFMISVHLTPGIDLLPLPEPLHQHSILLVVGVVFLHPVVVLALVLVYLLLHLELGPHEGDLQLLQHLVHRLELQLHQLLVYAELL